MKAESGFTLIEVLAALLVLALSLGSIMGAAGFYGRNAVYLNNKLVASWVADNQIERTRLERSWPALGRSDGRVEMAQQEWLWLREVKKTPDDRLRRVNLKVRLAAADDDDWLVNFSAFLAQPAAKTPLVPAQ